MDQRRYPKGGNKEKRKRAYRKDKTIFERNKKGEKKGPTICRPIFKKGRINQ